MGDLDITIAALGEKGLIAGGNGALADEDGAGPRQHKSVVTTADDHEITYHNHHNENIPCGL